MNAEGARIVLLLYADEPPSAEFERLAGALREMGAEVRTRSAGAPYDALCDDIAAADTALFWR